MQPKVTELAPVYELDSWAFEGKIAQKRLQVVALVLLPGMKRQQSTRYGCQAHSAEAVLTLKAVLRASLPRWAGVS